MAKRVREVIGVAITVAIVALALHFTHIGCPIKFATGISCPGCGMTRAWLAILAGDLEGAFAFHPLFWAAPAALVLVLVRDLVPRHLTSVTAASLVAALLIVWVARLGGSVTSRPDNVGTVVGIDTPAWVSALQSLADNAS